MIIYHKLFKFTLIEIDEQKIKLPSKNYTNNKQLLYSA